MARRHPRSGTAGTSSYRRAIALAAGTLLSLSVLTGAAGTLITNLTATR